MNDQLISKFYEERLKLFRISDKKWWNSLEGLKTIELLGIIDELIESQTPNPTP